VPVALVLTAGATLGASVLLYWLPPQGLSLVFLPFVLLAAVGFGVGTGLATAVASFLAYNFFFIPPTYTFRITDPQDILALLVFFVVALMTGSLAGRMREVADDARRRAAALQGLNDLALSLTSAVHPEPRERRLRSGGRRLPRPKFLPKTLRCKVDEDTRLERQQSLAGIHEVEG
jgi:two-component system sensor histidine kinase KdpD